MGVELGEGTEGEKDETSWCDGGYKWASGRGWVGL